MALSFLYAKKDDVKKHLLGLDVSDIPSTLDGIIESKYLTWAQRDVDSFCGQNFDKTVIRENYDGTGSELLTLKRRPVREVIDIRLDIIPGVQWVQFKRWFYIQNINRTGIQVARKGGANPNPPTETNNPPYTFPVGLGFTNESATPTASFIDTRAQYEATDLFVDCEAGQLIIPPRVVFMEGMALPFWNYTWIRGRRNIWTEYSYGFSDPTAADALTGSASGNLPAEITDATAMWACKYVLADKAVSMGAGAKSMTIDGVSRTFGEMPYEGVIKLLDERARQILSRYKFLGV